MDIKFIPTVSKSSTSNATFQTAKVQAAKVLLTGDDTYEDITSKDDLVINVKSFPNPNVIQANYNQGILLTEGCSAKIIANKIEQNIKANIACGGKMSGNTRIKYNYIENSKSEGVFVIEGEDNLLIEDNQIAGNNDGIVLVHSKGVVRQNMIKANQRSGLLTAGDTRCVFELNVVEDNLAAGILIKDPSLPEMFRNEISKNTF